MVKKRWVAQNSDRDYALILSKETGINKDIVKILLNRDVDTKEKIDRFLYPDTKDFHDPFLFKDMKICVDRIERAIESNEIIGIYGDYDVDGITGIAILYRYLKDRNVQVVYSIPNRLKEGYGINMDNLKELKEQGVKLIISVDCGITAVAEAKWLEENHIDFIITDHHDCPKILPAALGIINPKRAGEGYPFHFLAGAGVAFKLIQALAKDDEAVVHKFLPYAALGTIADIVPLLDENRTISSLGIKKIREGVCAPINALLENAGIKTRDVTARALSFQLAPRINAAGRMGNAIDALKLILSDDEKELLSLAEFLRCQNELRKKVEKEIIDEARAMVLRDKKWEKKEILIIGKEGWHSGVIGICASRISDEFYKPCILVAFEDNIGKGSLRSIEGFDLHEALEKNSKYLDKYGGHAMAAGITIKRENFEAFKRDMENYAKEHINDKMKVKNLIIESEITKENFTLDFVREVSMLEPFGIGNPCPVFVAKDVTVKKSLLFSGGEHLLVKGQIKNEEVEAVGFFLGKYAPSLRIGENILLAGTVGVNEYRGIKRFQMRIKDIRLGKSK